jgi:hypothetical protein
VIEVFYNNLFTRTEHNIVFNCLKYPYAIGREGESYRMNFYKNYQEAKQRLLKIFIERQGWT